MKFREKKTGKTWYIHNAEHIKSFLLNKNFEQIKEEKNVSKQDEEVENKEEVKEEKKVKKTKNK